MKNENKLLITMFFALLLIVALVQTATAAEGDDSSFLSFFSLDTFFELLDGLFPNSTTGLATGSGVNYYVDATNGDDTNNNGLSEGSPWKTIAKVKGRTFNPGDAILFKRGEIWRDQLLIPSSGNSIDPITFGAYGSGEKPIITGANIVTGWSPSGTLNVWTIPLGKTLQVFYNDVRGANKSTLNDVTVQNDWFWDPSINRLYIYSAQNPDVSGVKVEAAQRDYAIDINSKSFVTIRELRLEKTNHVPLYIKIAATNVIIDGNELYQGLPYLSSENAGILMSPNSANIEIKNNIIGKNTGNNVTEQSWASFKGIIVRGTNQKIHDNQIYHTSVERNHYSAFNAQGIAIDNIFGTIEVYNNYVYHTGGHGIYTRSNTNQGDVVRIYDNTLEYNGQAGVAAYQTRAKDGVGGIGYIYNNDISFCDWHAGSTGGDGNSACGVHLNDGEQSGTDPTKPFIKWKVYQNTIYNCQAPLLPNNEDSCGVAIDYNANNAEIYHNLIYNNWGKGIYSFNADNALIWGNIIYGNDAGIIISAVTNDLTETANNNKIFNNVLYRNDNGAAYGPNYYDAEIYFGQRDTGTIIKNNILYADSNEYVYNFANDRSTGNSISHNLVYTSVPSKFATGYNFGVKTLTQWKTYGYDVNATLTDPMFVSSTNPYDFHLIDASSGIDAGTGVTLSEYLDFEGNQIPYQNSAFDIGAYESISSAQEPSCGNNIIEGSEVCDGSSLNSQTCISQGFVSGKLGCLNDCTGYDISSCVSASCTDNDGDTFGSNTTDRSGCATLIPDCNDANNTVKPGASEICNAVDDNCNNQTNEGGVCSSTPYYCDSDIDTYYNKNISGSCIGINCKPANCTITQGNDCNDNNINVNPGITEACNYLDDNCNNQTDEGAKITFYRDADTDTYGNYSVLFQACTAPLGYVANSTDCNDGNNAIKPLAAEVCNNVDDNCNNITDEGVRLDLYSDTDYDGYGNPNNITGGCSVSAGYVLNNLDCNDRNFSIKPNATEICNNADDDCDGQTDEGVVCGITNYYCDNDGDFYRSSVISGNCTTFNCVPAACLTSQGSDCNDQNGAVNPGINDTTCDGIDNNCDGIEDEGVMPQATSCGSGSCASTGSLYCSNGAMNDS